MSDSDTESESGYDLGLFVERKNAEQYMCGLYVKCFLLCDYII